MHLPQDALVREMAGGAYKVGLPLWPSGNRDEETEGCWMWDFERRTSQLHGPAVVVVAVGRGMPRVMPCAGRASEGKEFYVCVTGERHRAGL